ncbi:hypothetical protein [Fontivita pretiosa]|uniref:hypothetical protein n=1 Tax=Fontivita pretiosa TaxID=2989684 RepID=UPI003D170625
MNAQWLLGWWNLVFLVPFALALLYLGVYTLSGWTFGDADADMDSDVDSDLDADADMDADADVDAHADVDAEADHDLPHAEHDVETDGSALGSALWAGLSFLGVGQVPLSIVMMILLLTWGGIGFATNQLAREHVGQSWHVAMYSLPLAAIASLLITSGTSRAINRFMPLNLSTAKRRHELLGSGGEVILPVDSKFGLVSVRDESGDLYQVPCRLECGDDEHRVIPKGARVKLVAYSAKESLFYVLPVSKSVYASSESKTKQKS